jgi:SAM-dependent methyltransferase
MTTEQDIKAYYNRHHQHKGEGSWRPAEAFPYFVDLAGVTSGDSILDIGCGTGFLLRSAAAHGAETFGLDISEEALKLAGQSAPTADLRTGNAEELPFKDGQFDHVFCLGAMEHFLDMDKGLDEMIRVTRTGGSLCVVVPNDQFLWWLFHPQKGTHQQAIQEQMNTLEGWTTFFNSHGVRVKGVHQDRDWFLHGRKIFSTCNPLHWLRVASVKLRWSLLPLKRTYQFIFLLEKK